MQLLMVAIRSLAAAALLQPGTRTAAATSLSIVLEPTADFDNSKDFAGLMFFKVATPDTTNEACSTNCSDCTTPGEDFETPRKCGGQVEMDLSAHSKLDISFEAKAGYELVINGPERSRIEFQATVDCPESTAWAGAFYQNFDGPNLTVNAAGSKVSALKFNKDSSFVTLGRCVGCSKCEVYTRIQYDGPIDDARITQIAWSAEYDKTNTIAGKQTYYYGTDTYCWIRGASAPGSARRLGSWSGNTFSLAKASGVSMADGATRPTGGMAALTGLFALSHLAA